MPNNRKHKQKQTSRSRQARPQRRSHGFRPKPVVQDMPADPQPRKQAVQPSVESAPRPSEAMRQVAADMAQTKSDAPQVPLRLAGV